MLYAIEDEVRRTSEEQCRSIRNERSRIILDDLRQYLDARTRRVSAKAKLGEEIRYTLTRWEGHSRFLDDGRIDLDSNTVERINRSLALNRKNALFAVSDEGGDNGAVIATLIENCKISGINPHVWLTEAFAKLAAGHPRQRRRRTHALDSRGLKTSLTVNRKCLQSNPRLDERRQLVSHSDHVEEGFGELIVSSCYGPVELQAAGHA